MEIMSDIAKSSQITESARQAFSADCLRKAVCLEWLATQLHPEGARCPGCGREVDGKQLIRWKAFERLQCHGCGKFFTAITGTWMSGAKISPKQIFVLAVLIQMDVETPVIASAVGVSEVTVRFWADKFKTLEALA
jgi:transposase-like protein